MFKRTIVAVITFAALLCLTVTGDAADVRPGKDDTWLVYMYLCGTDLEENGHVSTKNIAEMQRIKLPPNVKVLIYAGGTNLWHHPTIAANGDGIYLYSSNRLEKQVDMYADNMGDPNTLASFLKYGEDNFPADHKILLFWNHGGLSGVCYDDKFAQRNDKGEVVDRPYLTYDALKGAFAAVYGNSPEEPPFELVGFKACMTGSYELANSLADFSRYMMGAEPSVYDWNFSDWFADLAKDPSMNGAKLGKAICDSAMSNYDEITKLTHTFSVIDLAKMPELREAYEAYFDEALKRANDETGFSGAFARAAESRNADRYSNWYTDLGLLAKNTKSIMPDASKKLLGAIDKAVVYNKHGAYINSKGISTYYPYVSSEKVYESSDPNVVSTKVEFEQVILKQNSSYAAQKELYRKLLELDISSLKEEIFSDENDAPEGVNILNDYKSNRFFVQLMPKQLENVSEIKCMTLPVTIIKDENSNPVSAEISGAVLISADDLKIDWKKGTVTENFRAVEPLLDGHKISMIASVSGRGHTFYEVPILYNGVMRKLLVRYDTSAKKYEIFGFGSMVENGMMRQVQGRPVPGAVITPIYMAMNTDPSDDIIGYRPELDEKTGKPVPLRSIVGQVPNPADGKNYYIKRTLGEPFVFTRDSAITERKINRGYYIYFFEFTAPNGQTVASASAVIGVDHGEVARAGTLDLKFAAER